MKDNQIVVYTGWDGCGTTPAYVFFLELKLKASQWATAKTAAIGDGMSQGLTLDELYRFNRSNLTQIHDNSISLENSFRAFSGWPYSLFYKQIDEDPDLNCLFIHAERDVVSWSEHEIGFHYVKGVPLETFQQHAEYIYGSRLDDSSTIETWQKWIDRYKQHNTEVKNYFLDKSDRYLFLDLDVLTDIQKGITICNFLDIPYTDQEFPSATVSEWMNLTNQNKINSDSFQDVWNSRKPNLNFN